MATLFASFPSFDMAEKAVGALLDQGAKPIDISLVANMPPDSNMHDRAEATARVAEADAKGGITTTTAADATIGAEKGAMLGAGAGILAALAALTIPGLGLVIGGGALVTAIVGAAGATAAGAAVGGVAGYLKDQGMGPEVVTHYSTVFEAGGAILGVAVPSGDLLPDFAEQILAKYGATNIATYHGSRSLLDSDVPKEPLVIDNPNLDPLVIRPAVPGVVEVDVARSTIDPLLSEPAIMYVPDEVVQRATIRPVLIDPVTGAVERAVLIDPFTNLERPIRYEGAKPIYWDDAPQISEHPLVTEESDTVLNADDPTRPTVIVTGSERVTLI